MKLTSPHRRAARSLGVALGAGVIAASLAAASGTASAASAHRHSPKASSLSGSISWWGWTPTNSALANEEIAAFNKIYPKVHVSFKLITIANWVTALRPALVSGDGPDVFDMQPGAYVTQFNSFAQDMAPVAKKALGPKWKTKVAPSGVSGLTYNGKLTALSVGSVYAGTLWINPGLFQKYHLSPPATLTSWVHDCKVFKAHGVGCFLQGNATEGFLQDTLQSITNSIQPGLWTKASLGTAKWNTPGIVKALGVWKQLFHDGVMQSGSLGYQQYPDANNAFLQGKYAMIMMGTWYMQNETVSGMKSAMQAAGISNPKPFAIQPIAFPKVGKYPSAMYGDSDYGIAVYNRSKNIAAAEAFAQYLSTNQAGQQTVANQLDDLPNLRSVQPDFHVIKLVNPKLQLAPTQQLIKQVSTVTEPRESLLSADVQNAILAAAQSVASGSASPKQAADTLQKAAVAAGEKFK